MFRMYRHKRLPFCFACLESIVRPLRERMHSAHGAGRQGPTVIVASSCSPRGCAAGSSEIRAVSLVCIARQCGQCMGLGCGALRPPGRIAPGAAAGGGGAGEHRLAAGPGCSSGPPIAASGSWLGSVSQEGARLLLGRPGSCVPIPRVHENSRSSSCVAERGTVHRPQVTATPGCLCTANPRLCLCPARSASSHGSS